VTIATFWSRVLEFLTVRVASVNKSDLISTIRGEDKIGYTEDKMFVCEKKAGKFYTIPR